MQGATFDAHLMSLAIWLHFIKGFVPNLTNSHKPIQKSQFTFSTEGRAFQFGHVTTNLYTNATSHEFLT